MLVLGIETSCDETASAVVRDGREILSNVVSSSVHLHKRYGGIVPEIASRFHVEYITHVVDMSLKKADIRLKDIELIAVTYGPGLVGALLIGVSMAKALSFAMDLPIVGVNHLHAHIYGCLMGKPHEMDKLRTTPFVGLVISGGHTMLLYVKAFDKYELIGQTMDDACGEVFDKVAKILNLGYPGGPIIDILAKRGKPKIDFPRANLRGSFNFSFSGLKTSVLYYVSNNFSRRASYAIGKTQDAQHMTQTADIAASFQEAALDVVIDKSLDACRKYQSRHLVVGGGVSANSRLRNKMISQAKSCGIEVLFPRIRLCADNAAMVAGLGYHLYLNGHRSSFLLSAEPNLGIT